jgi:hypothetical protein
LATSFDRLVGDSRAVDREDFGTSPIQAEKSLPDRKCLWIRNAGNQGSRQRRTDARYIVEPPAGFAGSVPSRDHTIALEDLGLQHPQLGAKRGNTGAGNLRQSFVICIGGDPEQLLDTMASDRRDDTKLGHVSTDGIDHRGVLADEQVTGTVQRQAALLL